jgi:hypothetical protein
LFAMLRWPAFVAAFLVALARSRSLNGFRFRIDDGVRCFGMTKSGRCLMSSTRSRYHVTAAVRSGGLGPGRGTARNCTRPNRGTPCKPFGS